MERSADILLNDKYVDTLEICDNEEAWLEGLIRYDYTDVDWLIIDSSDISGYGYNSYIPGSGTMRFDNTKKVNPFLFPHVDQYGPKDWTVNMFVTRTTPICDHTIRDTVTATIRVYPTHQNDTTWDANGGAKTFCYGDTIDIDYSEDGNRDHVKPHRFIADTITPAVINKNPYGTITFKLDSIYTFRDSLKNHFGCDSIIEKKLIIRPTYDTIVYDSICINRIDSINRTYRNSSFYDSQGNSQEISIKLSYTEYKNLNNPSKFVKPLQKEDSVKAQTIYGCDSTIHLKLTILPVYKTVIDTSVCINEDEPFIWSGHTRANGNPVFGHKIYYQDDNGFVHTMRNTDVISRAEPREEPYVYIDSMRTLDCRQCENGHPGCDSVVILRLIVKDQLKEYERRYLCDNESFVWKDTFFMAPKYTGSIPAKYQGKKNRRLTGDAHLMHFVESDDPAHRCDSVYSLRVYFCPTYDTTQVFHICENETYTYKPRSPKTHPHDKVYNQNHEWACIKKADGSKEIGRYVLKDTVKTIAPCRDGGEGCDSIVTHIVYVHPVYNDTTFVTECQSHTQNYSWNAIKEATVWDKQRKTKISKTAIPLDKTGDFVYIDSLKTRTCTNCRNGVGCDSILVLCLHVNPIYDTIEQRSLCENDTIHWRGKVFVGGKGSGSTRKWHQEALLGRPATETE